MRDKKKLIFVVLGILIAITLITINIAKPLFLIYGVYLCASLTKKATMRLKKILVGWGVGYYGKQK